ncbi:MAG TPA: family 1 encapsulin nanocompartment shell protein, partial [Candidatus Tectomicrobia bacterium]|nr:family 1 encapsulin nanocompartment shell protein [Candidatus Tectomicrobia bacterium]
MDYLRREAAPISERVWKALDDAVVQAARHVVAARRIATFDGPHGWDHVATRLGTMTPCRSAEGRAVICVPEVVLLSEVRVDFSLPWSSIEVYERGAPVLDTGAAEAAARELGLAEDRIAFYGDPVGNGFLTSSESPRAKAHDWSRPGQVLADLVHAVELLDAAGVPGPYEAVLTPARYYAYLQATDESGYPTARQLREVLAAVHRAAAASEAGAV